MTSADTIHKTRAGSARPLLLMIGAMASFVANDTLIKTVVDQLPVGEIVLVRGIIAAMFIAVIARAQGLATGLSAVFSRPVCIRAGIDTVGTLLFVFSLGFMQIANLTAVLQAVPLAVTLIGLAFLGESVGWRRILAIVIGFCGVLLVVKPSASLSLHELSALGVVIAVALRDVATKRIAASVPSVTIALANAVFVTSAGAILLVFQDAVPLTFNLFIRLAGAAVFLALGYLCMVATLRSADLSTTAPARYSIIVFAIMSGVLVFGQFPDRWACAGIVLIVSSGFYAIRRGEARARKAELAA